MRTMRTALRRGTAVLRVGAVVATVGVAVAGCIPYQGNRDGPRVAIVGDSNTILAAAPSALSEAGPLRELLHPLFQTTIQAQAGKRIVDMLDELQAQVDNPAGRPDAVVVYLGTNDVMVENPDWRAAFDAMLAVVADVPCVELVTVNTDTDAMRGQTTTTASGINAAIAAAAAAEPDRVHVVPWNVDWTAEMGAPDPAITEHPYSVFFPPERLDDHWRASFPDGVWLGDGVHQSPEGSMMLARLYRDQLVEDCFPEVAPG